MSVYLIVEIEVRNQEMYRQYVEKVPKVIAEFGGRYLSQGGRIRPLSGDWNPERIVIREFPSLEQLQGCFSPPAYQKIAPSEPNQPFPGLL